MSKNGKEIFYSVPLNPPDLFWQAPSWNIALCLSWFVASVCDKKDIYLIKNVAFWGVSQGPNLVPFTKPGSTKTLTLISGTCSSVYIRAAQVLSSPAVLQPCCSSSVLEIEMCIVTCTTLVVNIMFFNNDSATFYF